MLWSPFVVPHGLIAFHDVGNWPGVTQFYQELMRGTPAYREVGAVMSLRIVEKAAPASVAATPPRAVDQPVRPGA